jgi:hypothetical protein
MSSFKSLYSKFILKYRYLVAVAIPDPGGKEVQVRTDTDSQKVEKNFFPFFPGGERSGH